jgi:flavin-dependent dehydrogenase
VVGLPSPDLPSAEAREGKGREGGEGKEGKPSHGVDAFYAPPVSRLDDAVVAAAVAAGAEFRRRTTVTEVLRRQHRVVGVRALTPAGTGVELRAGLVVGADGAGSTVARAVEAPFIRLSQSVTAVAAAYWALDTHAFEWHLGHETCSGVVPTDPGLACVFVSG